jgi:hypothetical protein
MSLITKNRSIFLVVLVVVLLALAIIVVITYSAVNKTYSELRLDDICPDYFSTQYVYVVDKNINALDSIPVTLRDNSNLNVIYNTFTDSTGRFALFNDFSSFALSNLPFSYELHVSFNGHTDSLVYKFKRYRICHFRKVSGPDTIIINDKKSCSRIPLNKNEPLPVETAFDYVPFEKMGLSGTAPSCLKRKLQNWGIIVYGSFTAGKRTVPFAIVDKPGSAIPGGFLYKGVCYILDRNRNGDLGDDPVKQWKLLSSNGIDDIADCDIRQCYLRDTISMGDYSATIDLQLKNFYQSDPGLYFRRGDAVKTKILVQGKTLDAVIWDRCLLDYSDLRFVQIGIDLNSDGKITGSEGDPELLESALLNFTIDAFAFEIDSIYPDAKMIVYRNRGKNKSEGKGAGEGSWAQDFKTFYAQPLSLYNEISSNKLVLLYFFEGNSHDEMESYQLRNVATVLEKSVGDMQIIGINRKSNGEHCEVYPVIEENRGWKGTLVQQFRNHREKELVIIDNNGTIICRGVPGNELIESLWQKLGRNDLEKVLSANYRK